MPYRMLNEFEKYITENNLVEDRDRILLAVSGGIDSMVMTHLFLELGYEIGIAHCNFELRGEESDMDEQMVAGFAQEHNIEFFTTRFKTESYASGNSMSIQMAARELRYTWFEEIRLQNGYNAVAVAHNLNDNIETLIINLVRGTGLAGLTGMRPRNNNIIRPLLFATRNDISKYCKEHNILYREDKSNSDTKYIRNKIRHKIIPVLKEINPSVELTLNENAERFTGINEIVTEYICKLREKVSEQKQDITTFSYTLLKRHLKNRAVIFELFKPFGINNLRLNDLISVIKGKTGARLYTDSYRILKNRNEIMVTMEHEKDEIIYIIRKISDFRKVPEIISATWMKVNDSFEIPSDQSVACIDGDRVKFPLLIRNWKPGDYFVPLGMKQRKKLSDYFIDNKYSIPEKENKQILESDGKIIWIIGDRIDNRVKITKSTREALIIKSIEKALVIKPLR